MFELIDLEFNPQIRKWQEGNLLYFSVIDTLAELRGTDFRKAQNYYHVLMRRLTLNGEHIPDIKRIKAKSSDGKMYLTDFTTLKGVEKLQELVARNIRNKTLREKVRQDDEVVNFHPIVIAQLEKMGWCIKHHVRLSSGKIIDIIAYQSKNLENRLVIECKPDLNGDQLFRTIGQVLCYWGEYDTEASAGIATYSKNIPDYARQSCHRLGIHLIEIEG
jgi:hypothetical protein